MLTGVIENGQVRLDRPADLPDGTEVAVMPYHLDGRGLSDADWPADAGAVAALIARIEALEPFDMSPAEESDADAWRLRVKRYTLDKQNATAEGPFG